MNKLYEENQLIIVMGVSGCGKTSVAKALSDTLGIEYLEADDFHSPQAKALMESGKALTDTMREPWINEMCKSLVVKKQHNTSCILAYSGLKKLHRQRFRELGYKTQFLFLNGSYELIKKRVEQRQNHFFSSNLLASQFEALELPVEESDVFLIDIEESLDKVVEVSRSIISFT